MSDIVERLRGGDIVERLRESGLRSEIELHEDREEAAARIEELMAENVQLQARLDEVKDVLMWISTEERLDHINGGLCLTDGAKIARTTLTELKGEDDE